jgi:hypothetical protein
VAADVLPHQQRPALAVERGRGVDGSGDREQILIRWTRAGTAASRAMGQGAPTGAGSMRACISSMAVDPHMPHAEVVVATRALGVGATPPVSTDTTLKPLSTALPVAQ